MGCVAEQLRQGRIQRLRDTVSRVTWHIYRCDDELVCFGRDDNRVFCSCQPIEEKGETCCLHIEAVRLVKEDRGWGHRAIPTIMERGGRV